MTDFTSYFNQEIDTDLMDALGDDVVFIPSGGIGVSIKGAFNNAYYEAANGAEIGVQSSSPAIECLDRDVINAEGGRIIRDGVTYDIIGPPQPDGTGITLLILRHAQ